MSSMWSDGFTDTIRKLMVAVITIKIEVLGCEPQGKKCTPVTMVMFFSKKKVACEERRGQVPGTYLKQTQTTSQKS